MVFDVYTLDGILNYVFKSEETAYYIYTDVTKPRSSKYYFREEGTYSRPFETLDEAMSYLYEQIKNPKKHLISATYKKGDWCYIPSTKEYKQVVDVLNDDVLCFSDSPEDRTLSSSVVQAKVFTYNEEKMADLVGKVIKRGADSYLVTAHRKHKNTVSISLGELSSIKLLEKGYTMEGKPCGTLKHLSDEGVWVE